MDDLDIALSVDTLVSSDSVKPAYQAKDKAYFKHDMSTFTNIYQENYKFISCNSKPKKSSSERLQRVKEDHQSLKKELN